MGESPPPFPFMFIPISHQWKTTNKKGGARNKWNLEKEVAQSKLFGCRVVVTQKLKQEEKLLRIKKDHSG